VRLVQLVLTQLLQVQQAQLALQEQQVQQVQALLVLREQLVQQVQALLVLQVQLVQLVKWEQLVRLAQQVLLEPQDLQVFKV
jgi:hypothetical protein